MSNNRTGPDYLDRKLPKKKKRKSTEGGYQSPDGTFHPGLKPQYQKPPKLQNAGRKLKKK